MGYRTFRDQLLRRPAVREAYDSQRELAKLGRLLQRVRAASKLRQQDVAALTGIAQADISRLEHGLGERGPTFETMVRLAHAHNMKLVVQLVPELPANRKDAPQLDEDDSLLREAF